MSDLLNTLFSYDYFGPILFVIIAVLIVLFFIILFFGKKDEKERKLEETRRLEELANINAFKDDNIEQKLEVEESKIDLPVVDDFNNEYEDKPLDEIFTSLRSLEEDDVHENVVEEKAPFNNELKEQLEVVQTEPVLSPIEEEPLLSFEEFNLNNIDNAGTVEETTEEPVIDRSNYFKIEPSIPEDIPKYTFEELANSISRELEEIEKLNSKKEDSKKDYTSDLGNVKVEVTPIKEIQKKGAMPVFSSVFVPSNNKTIENEELPKVEDNLDEVKENNVNETIFAEEKKETEVKDEVENKIDFSKLKAAEVVSPRPAVVLPKQIELPKKNVEVKNEGTNIPDLSDIEGETYSLK